MKASGASAPAAPLPQARTRRHSRAGVWLTLSTLPSCHGLRGLACLPDAPGAEAPVGGAAAARGAVVRHGPLRRDARPLEEAEAPPHGRDAGLLASTTLASSSGGARALRWDAGTWEAPLDAAGQDNPRLRGTLPVCHRSGVNNLLALNS